MVKQSLEKQPTLERGADRQIPDSIGDKTAFPPKHYRVNGKSLGNPMVEMATPKGTNNLTGGTNKNELRV
jgi:hypothetical protein